MIFCYQPSHQEARKTAGERGGGGRDTRTKAERQDYTSTSSSKVALCFLLCFQAFLSLRSEPKPPKDNEATQTQTPNNDLQRAPFKERWKRSRRRVR